MNQPSPHNWEPLPDPTVWASAHQWHGTAEPLLDLEDENDPLYLQFLQEELAKINSPRLDRETPDHIIPLRFTAVGTTIVAGALMASHAYNYFQVVGTIVARALA
jgi:hypothetical protein